VRALIVLAAIIIAHEASAAPERLSLGITVPKPQILVGEPVKVVTTWMAITTVDVRKRAAQVMVHRGQGFELWGEAAPVNGTVVESPQRLEQGRPQITEHVVAVAGPTRQGEGYTLAFPTAAVYRVMVRYKLGAEYVTSNVATVTASTPEGREALLLQHLRREPETLVARQADLGGRERLEELFAAYPGTPYLARPRIILLEKLLYDAIGRAPDPIPPTGPLQGDVPALLERLANEDLGNSPFEEDRLLVLAEMRGRSGRGAEAIATYRQVILRYPNGYAAGVAISRIPPEAQPTP
jgi:hypothetical protein